MSAITRSSTHTRRPPIEKTVTAGRHELRVRINPGGQSTPLLLMNGIGARLELLDGFVDHLSPDREVIRFDPPGIGESNASGFYRARGLTRAVADVLDELGYDVVDVLGISWGGGLAQQFAFSHGHRCGRLVLVSTGTGSIMIPPHPRVLSKMLSPRRYRDPDFMAAVAADIYGGTMRQDATRAVEAIRSMNFTRNSIGYFAQLAAVLGWTSLAFLPFMSRPTLIMSGNDDPLIAVGNAKIMHKLIPNSELHLFDGGHIALVTEAPVLAPIVESFLDRTEVQLATAP